MSRSRSGLETDAPLAWLFQREGKRIAAILTFPGPRQALEAAAR